MKRSQNAAPPKLGALAELVRNARLTWRLLKDKRVSPLLKAIVPGTLVYLVLPADLIPDMLLGLGQVDDLAMILLGLRLFLQLCPGDIVAEHVRQLSGGDSDTVDVTYRVLDEDDDPTDNEEPLP